MPSDFLDRSRRAVYRVTYPIPERPTLTLGHEVFPVIDCSELGLRYEAPYSHNPAVGGTVLGVVSFRRGVDFPVSGEVLRLQDTVSLSESAPASSTTAAPPPPSVTVALTFRDHGIPFGEIVAEQRYLRAEGYLLGDTGDTGDTP